MRILLTTSDRWAAGAAATLRLLSRYWPDHPPVDVLYHAVRVPSELADRQISYGPTTEIRYAAQLRRYLDRDADDDPAVLLILGDYGMCAAADPSRIAVAANAVRTADTEFCLLTWFPMCDAPTSSGLCPIAATQDAVVKLGAGVWDKGALDRVAAMGGMIPVRFETDMVAALRAGLLRCSRVIVPEPEVDRWAHLDQYSDADKAGWALPYHNLYQGGVLNPDRRGFVEREGLLGMMPPYPDHAEGRPDIPLAGDVVEGIAKAIGADRLMKLWTKWTGVPCGCDERKEKLNRATIALLTWWERRRSREGRGTG